MARLGAAAVLAALLAAAFLAAAASASPKVPVIHDLNEAAALNSGREAAARAAAAKCSDYTLDGECIVDDQEELGLSGGGGGVVVPGAGEVVRRTLAARKPTNRYISYAALRADQVPCNKRGRSYYSNCASQQAANPYRRGCSAITRCARNMN